MVPSALPILLGLAVLLPLASFFFILLFGPRLGKAFGDGAYVATGAIVISGVLSFLSLFIWLGYHPPEDVSKHHGDAVGQDAVQGTDTAQATSTADGDHGGEQTDGAHAGAGAADAEPPHYCGDFYTLGRFGELHLSIGYYIDSLTICMFCLVSLIASCIHFYSMGYMHEELHEVTDHEVILRDGAPLRRPGRYPRFFQYLSLFCFSMLGLLLAGNLAMVFVFWELVGICSYFLIGFYIERKSATNAANKAFIVNRIGDFGMLVGMMALWAGLGTFSFGDVKTTGADGQTHVERGIFSLVRPGPDHALRTPDGMARLAAVEDEAANPGNRVASAAGTLDGESDRAFPPGYGLLIVAGIGIFCGCVGKSAQFPLHVWLPDAMEGPTPVSALVHSATMVAAGVYLVGRFYPVFAPEVLLVIAVTGCITLFMAATVAITATDIKRVLAYSTVSQLGYMMLALGVGGWVAGLLHLVTHAFFKSLLFLCSGSVIHAVHTNEMTEMGGLRKKMPITACTMLIGCLAIAGISIPFVIGFSGYYSKDRILEQAYAFMQDDFNGAWATDLFFYAAAGGAAITAFYMFRMWFMTFAGKPRNARRYEHAHESPRVMTVPLIVLAVFATVVAWQPFSGQEKVGGLSLVNLLEQARPAGMSVDMSSDMLGMKWPRESFAHEDAQRDRIVKPVTWFATFASWAGIALAIVMYRIGYIDPAEVQKQFRRIDRFLRNKWWFDELYELIFVRPLHVISRIVAAFDRGVIDGLVDGSSRVVRSVAVAWDWLADVMLVDGSVNLFARCVYRSGLWLRKLQTGRLRQYVLFIVIGMLAVFVLISFLWGPTWAG
jgi:NADH-quinone oxidoreductase subunit L